MVVFSGKNKDLENILKLKINVCFLPNLEYILWTNNSCVEWIVGYTKIINNASELYITNLTNKTLPKEYIFKTCEYFFITKNIDKMTCSTGKGTKAYKWLTKFGFKEVLQPFDNIVLLELKKEDCKWIDRLKPQE